MSSETPGPVLPKHANEFVHANQPDVYDVRSPEETSPSHSLSKTGLILGLGRAHAISESPFVITKDHLKDVSAEKIDYDALTKLTLKSREDHWKEKDTIVASSKDILKKYDIDPEAPKANSVVVWTAITSEQLMREKDNKEFVDILGRFGIHTFDDPKELQKEVTSFWGKYLNEEGENKGKPQAFVDDFVGEVTNENRDQIISQLDAISPLLGAWGESDAMRDAIMLKAGIVPDAENEELLSQDVQNSYHSRLIAIQKELAGGSDRRDVSSGLSDKEGEVHELNAVTSLPANEGATTLLQIPVERETTPLEVEKDVSEPLDTFAEYFQAHAREILNRPELAQFKEWYERELERFSDMTLSDTDILRKGWNRTIEDKIIPIESIPEEYRKETGISGYADADGVWHNVFFYLGKDGPQAVDLLASPGKGAQFGVYGKEVSRIVDGKTESWMQLLSSQGTEKIKVHMADGSVKEIDSSGFVGDIIDVNGRMLLSLEQELGSNAQKKVLLRTPVQISMGNIKKKESGELPATHPFNLIWPTIEKVLNGKTFEQGLEDGTIEASPFVDDDAQRGHKQNVRLYIPPVTPEELDAIIAQNPHFYPATPIEVVNLQEARLLNSHGALVAFDTLSRNSLESLNQNS